MFAACARPRARAAPIAVALLAAAAIGPVADATAEQASATAPAAGALDVGSLHSCALTAAGVRCWGFAADGQLGYANTATIGDDETPASAGTVDVGGAAVTAIAVGAAHTCALLADGSVHCWGFGADGRLGYANSDNVGDDESPASVGAVALGGPAKAISAGDAHTCAVLVDGNVRCWGFGGTGTLGGPVPDGRLGYGNNATIGDNETPATAGPVLLGAGNKAVAVSAGGEHTCALLDDGSVRCWGVGRSGRLGYGATSNVGDTPATTPDIAGAVNLGGLKAVAISAGGAHSCALLADGGVRCWGEASRGQLGYANVNNIGDDETPAAAGAVDLGGRAAVAISAGSLHTCAILDDGSVRCWGLGANGRLGYAATNVIGDDETPAAAGPVNLGGHAATAISAGNLHTCARLDDGHVRCWGFGATGRLGYCATATIGDDETPATAGPVALEPGDGAPGCPAPALLAPAAAVAPGPAAGAPRPLSTLRGDTRAQLAAQRARAKALRGCLARVAQGAPTRRSAGRRACLRRYGRTPGRVVGLQARAAGPHRIVVSFRSVGTDDARPPTARGYLVKQSARPLRSRADFRAAHSLCRGRCAFAVSGVGTAIHLTVTHLARARIYYYAVAGLDNVSGRRGPRSASVAARAG